MSTQTLNPQYSNELNKLYTTGHDMSTRDGRIQSCLKLALDQAKKYHSTTGTTMTLDDIVQAANLGLCIAADKYNNPEVKFSTYAYFWIKKYVLDIINVQARPLSVSTKEGYERVTDKYSFISKDADLQYGSNDEMIGDKNPVYKKLVSQYLTGDELIELERCAKSQRSCIDAMLNTLCREERLTVCALFGLAPFKQALTVKDICNRFGYRHTNVSNWSKAALHKMQVYAHAHNVNIAQVLSDANTLSNCTSAYDTIDNYVADVTDDISTEWLRNIAAHSNISVQDLDIALTMDTDDNYAFFSKRKIGKFTIWSKFRIYRRLRLGCYVEICMSYAVYLDDVEVLPDTYHGNHWKKVNLYKLTEWLQQHKVSQMHSPFYKPQTYAS